MTGDLRLPLLRPLDNTTRAWIAERVTPNSVTDAPSPSTDRATLYAHHLEVTDSGQTIAVHIKHAAGVLDFVLLAPLSIAVVYAPSKERAAEPEVTR
jgi:hypothetical protein